MKATDTYEGLRFSEVDGIGTVTLDRAEKYNTLTSQVISSISSVLKEVQQSESIRVLIIKATGKAFSTGHDLKEIDEKGTETFLNKLFTDCSEMMQLIRKIPQPVIAQVQGIATAAGCQLIASCDLVVSSADSIFATNGIDNGLYCATPSVALSRAMRPKHAFEMLLSGEFIDAARAAELGLVNRVVEKDLLEKETVTLAKTLASKSLSALRLGKKSFYEQINLDIQSAYQKTSDELVSNILSAEGQEGIKAFIERRKPEWTIK